MLVRMFPLDLRSSELAHALALAAQVSRRFAPDSAGAPISVVRSLQGAAARWDVCVDIPATGAGAALELALRAAEPIVLDEVALGLVASSSSPFIARE